MTYFLHQDVTPLAREQADCHVIGERAGGEKQAFFFAEQFGEASLEFLDGSAFEVVVGLAVAAVGEGGEQFCVVGGRETDSVACEEDAAFRRGGLLLGLRGVRQGHGGCGGFEEGSTVRHALV